MDRKISKTSFEDVVISGMSGRLPESNNLDDFRNHLFKQTDMVTDDDRRWKLEHPEVPKRFAKIYEIDKYDAGFFGVDYRQADGLDPTMRIFMETVVEAIMDAGMNPKELKGSRTGVFVGSSWLGTDFRTGSEKSEKFCMTGYLMSMVAHRVSYHLKLKGPSYVIDSACSSSLNALDIAFNYIRTGQLDNALVGGANLVLHSSTTLQFFRLGVLSTDGTCRVFDRDAAGYVRGETVACIFLQKAKNAKRVYAEIVNSKLSCDGFKEEGIMFPSSKAQQQLITEIYKESGISPSEITYLETHGTGTQVGDFQEIKAIDCALSKKRNNALLIGSVKSNIGHTEVSSGICSIIKTLIALDSGFIAPNLHYNRYKDGMQGLTEGRLKVVTELTEIKNKNAVIGINNFGFGGTNVHVILKRYNPEKNKNKVLNNLPMVVCVSGRTKAAVQCLLNDINKRISNVEYVGLFHQIFKTQFENHLYRGYTVVSKSESIKTSIQMQLMERLPLFLFFGRFENSFRKLGAYLLQFPVFKDIIARINYQLLQNKMKTFEEILENRTNRNNDIIGSICVEIALIDFFNILDILPTAVYGNFYGKLIIGYHKNVISLSATIRAAANLSEFDVESDSDFQSFCIKNNLNFTKIENKENWNYLHKHSIMLNISDSTLNKREHYLVEENTVKFLDILGRLFEQGYTPQLQKLYPEVQFPVGRGTPMISPLIRWNHKKNWYTYKFDKFTPNTAQRQFEISLMLDEYKFLSGHVVNGYNFFPVTEYLHLVWRSYSQSYQLWPNDLMVVFTNCKFVKSVLIPKSGYLKFLVTIQKGSGKFEVLEKGSLVATGYINGAEDIKNHQTHLQTLFFVNDAKETLQQDDILQRTVFTWLQLQWFV